MSITIEQVPRWTVRNGLGHVVMSAGGETRGVYTACRSLYWGGYKSIISKRPKRICAKCRAALASVSLSTPAEPEGGARG